MAGGKMILYRKQKIQKVQIIKKKKRKNVVLQRPIALKLVTTLRYAEQIKIRPTLAATAADYVFSLNGIYDPNITGIGHQPRGYDQIMALYEHYVVLGAKVTFQWACDDTITPVTVCLSQRADNTSVVDVSDIIEFNNVKMQTRGRLCTGPATMTMKVNPSKFLGRSKPLADPQLKGDINNNPEEQSYLHINTFFTSPTILGNGYTIGILTIDYICAFIEPKNVGQS